MSLENKPPGLDKFLEQCEKEKPSENLKIAELLFDNRSQTLKGSLTTTMNLTSRVTYTKTKSVTLSFPNHLPIQNLLDVSRSWLIRASKISSDKYNVKQFIRPIMSLNER
ncbi:MAG: hypothetical protein ACFFBD_15005 [Candidatus Hodarchaeota archaeon]